MSHKERFLATLERCPVALPYHSAYSDAICMAFDFAKHGHIDNEEGIR
jgi:hypothetical protein